MTFILDFENNLVLPALFSNLPASGGDGIALVDGDTIRWSVSGGYGRLLLIAYTDGSFSLSNILDIKTIMQSLSLFDRIDKFGKVAFIYTNIEIDEKSRLVL